jgi:hypothetical protein
MSEYTEKFESDDNYAQSYTDLYQEYERLFDEHQELLKKYYALKDNRINKQ